MDWKEARAIITSDPEVQKELENNKEEYELARQIIKARIEKKITQQGLATLIKTKQSNISRIETGRANPTIGFLREIAVALGKDLKIEFVDKKEKIKVSL